MKVLEFILLSSVALVSISQADGQPGFVQEQVKKTNPLFGYRVGPDTAPMSKPILRPFATDGCSLSPNSTLNAKFFSADSNGVYTVNFVECCVIHDIAYWLGGTQDEKDASDMALSQCITEKADKATAKAYFEGVQFGGEANKWNTFRWGYGWDSLRPYGPITTEEREQAEKLYGPGLVQLKDMIAKKQYKINLELLTLDFATNNRWHDDIIVYRFLQNTLKRNDVVSYGNKMNLTSLAFHYVIGLESCGSKRLAIKLDRVEMLKDIFYLQREIHKLPWEHLQKYIERVEDPEKCLE